MAYPVAYVADAILKIAKAKNKTLTPLQLMKLVYIAHGWHWAIRGTDLFPERIEAWKYGPVIPDLYHATKQYGRAPIPFERIGDDDIALDGDTIAFLEDVVDKYGHLSGFSLSSLTHKAGTPWDSVYQEGMMGIEIPDGLIRNHYASLLNEYQSASPAAST
jgi:uncharacterized phage-associated protein